MLITSLVQRDKLESAFPDQVDALPWMLEGLPGSIRSEFCRVQGLKSTWEVASSVTYNPTTDISFKREREFPVRIVQSCLSLERGSLLV